MGMQQQPAMGMPMMPAMGMPMGLLQPAMGLGLA